MLLLGKIRCWLVTVANYSPEMLNCVISAARNPRIYFNQLTLVLASRYLKPSRDSRPGGGRVRGIVCARTYTNSSDSGLAIMHMQIRLHEAWSMFALCLEMQRNGGPGRPRAGRSLWSGG